MNKFSFYVTFLVVSLASLLSSCKEEAIYPTIKLSQQSVFFSEKNQTTTFSYTGTDIVSVSASFVPEGWFVNINNGSRKITVVGPVTTEDFENSLIPETVTISAKSKTGNSGSDYLEVGTTNFMEDLSSQQANSFIVKQPNAIYKFNALVKGEGEEAIAPTKVAILWQSVPAPLSFSRLVDGKVEFHVASDKYDNDGDERYDDIIEGNAVIAAYDKSNNIVWSWHIWVSDFSADESAVKLNGVTFMSRNLGANGSSTASESDIRNSYGLYYQWGRKDPFTKPYNYAASNGSDASMLDEADAITRIAYEASTSSKGKEKYATQHPMTYLTGVENSSFDWLYSAHSLTLWGATKTVNDPCPKGWRVPSASAFEGLKIPSLTAQELAALSNSYGWKLYDKAGNGSLFMGAGRKVYTTGSIQNVNLNNDTMSPWAGYYWSADASSDELSKAMLFTYDANDLSGNQLMVSTYYRANGMQIRCQRDE